MDGHLRMCRNLAAWPAGRLEKMGLCYRSRQSTGLALFRLLSSSVGLGPDKLLVHVFLGSGDTEFLGEAENGVKANEPGDELGEKGESMEVIQRDLRELGEPNCFLCGKPATSASEYTAGDGALLLYPVCDHCLGAKEVEIGWRITEDLAEHE